MLRAMPGTTIAHLRRGPWCERSGLARPYLRHVVHEVHGRLVGFSVGQPEQGIHPEADGIPTVSTLGEVGDMFSIGLG